MGGIRFVVVPHGLACPLAESVYYVYSHFVLSIDLHTHLVQGQYIIQLTAPGRLCQRGG